MDFSQTLFPNLCTVCSQETKTSSFRQLRLFSSTLQLTTQQVLTYLKGSKQKRIVAGTIDHGKRHCLFSHGDDAN